MIEVRTLRDGAQKAVEVAAWVGQFLDRATRSLDVALYDLNLSAATEPTVIGAMKRAMERGVAVRVVYNEDDRNPIPVPPPPRTDPGTFAAAGIPARAIPGVPDLMHHKYVVRDGASVWTGSTNWTDDSWTREENVLAVVGSPELATAFTRDFEELWTKRQVLGTGGFDPDPDTIDGAQVQPWFSPGRGRRISHRIAGAIARAERRIRIASPVITSGPILGTLTEVATAGALDLGGVVDATQMKEVHAQWSADPHAGWKIPAAATVLEHAPFSGKRST